MDTPSYRKELETTVLRLMDEANARRVVPDPRAMRYQQLGDENIPVEGTEQPNGTPIYRHAKVSPAMQRRLENEWYNGPNFVQRFESLCKSRGNKRAFAYRPTIRVSQELVREPESGLERLYDVTYYDATKYLSYTEVWTMIENFGRGLRELDITVDCKVGIYLETRWEWLVSAYGVWSQNIVLATVYANLGEEALSEAFAETSCAAVVTVGERVPSLIAMMRRGAMPSCILIYLDDLPEGIDSEGVTLKAWEDVVRDGGLSAYPNMLPTKNDAVALIMYTSGTTGGPKGVVHTFGSITAGINGMGGRLNELCGPQEPDERYVAALPLAHIFEFAVANIFLTRGCWIGFGHPRTLLSTYARPHGDLVEFKPIFLIGVPRIFDNYKKTMEASLAPRGSLERKIFDHAFASRLKYLRSGMETPFWNEVVFAPLREMVGGRVRSMFGGGGPISAPTQNFMNVILGGFIQGWGLTETIGNGAKQLVGDLEPVCVGQLELACEFKLVDTEDYKHTDIPEPRGEICLRGPMQFKGYYKKEAVTKAVIDEEGWFHTGDVGAVADRGRLRIVSRIKSLAKNALGEYIPMENLESLYAQSSLCVPNGVCVVVNPSKYYVCAIACTTESKAIMFAQEHGVKGGWPALLKNPEFHRCATEAFREMAVHAGRGKQEIVRYVRVVADEWSSENGMLTAAGKLKRHAVAEFYKDIIRTMYVD
ncbi:putative fatty acyl CoA synthetase 2 [Leptomonas pyrrhocoris]|uniref:Putative fatty acyl CoA synthetase 2 n=1 Tax=Leptomonas pyrrhocoris TaxID=157538 RepID=A0A0M9FQ57_LEPPY|nr:putative fatty acyl CoA synthetase 2 [Leptomonas pyrrhocoris]XP_015652161.1 putative fatty acyl CoA synthetase 2 [Leptomonas pyrrhocoris]XP_015652162.1 putative fatty acyl CoA synthetase 2 [Leptomonas pyrrhocoris]KPA73721.1 putative fatty acyl CoA synthetase 2 [Leptomonas pyrrhocoris]KPA73722.1 putative fatty acyl CoA synthetase 2 [Leptomonas pyrrhocoris]KPA73723.1 putative fatty acyl CoA synthetase 2 [Leptomonas pyrrhocoris]|eukprot:XP_015652160.1 putative fatty acyl CoA synthetase 2 [Leptomonas pyrrhocoris]